MKARLLLPVGLVLAVGVLTVQNAAAQSIQDGFNQLHQNYGTLDQQRCAVTGCGGGTAAAPAAPAGPTPQQQMGSALGQAAMPLIQQGIHNLFYGTPAKPPDPAQQQREIAVRQLNNSGVYLFKQKNYSGAIHEFEQALAISPNDANILHNLSSARQRLKDSAVAAQTSGALSHFLGDTPAGAGNSNFDSANHSPAGRDGSALGLVNLDPSVVDLRGTTSQSPALLKSQIEGVFASPAPAAAPPVTPVSAAEEEREIKAIFEKPTPDPDATMKNIFDLNHKTE